MAEQDLVPTNKREMGRVLRGTLEGLNYPIGVCSDEGIAAAAELAPIKGGSFVRRYLDEKGLLHQFLPALAFAGRETIDRGRGQLSVVFAGTGSGVGKDGSWMGSFKLLEGGGNLGSAMELSVYRKNLLEGQQFKSLGLRFRLPYSDSWEDLDFPLGSYDDGSKRVLVVAYENGWEFPRLGTARIPENWTEILGFRREQLEQLGKGRTLSSVGVGSGMGRIANITRVEELLREAGREVIRLAIEDNEQRRLEEGDVPSSDRRKFERAQELVRREKYERGRHPRKMKRRKHD